MAAAAALALLAGCSSSDKVQPPAELTGFRSTADIQRSWSASLSGAKPRLRLGLGVAAAGDTVFAAGYDGEVMALNGADGRRLWRTDTKLRLSGGPGVGEGLVVVGANTGGIVALDAATGEEKWRTRINSEILSAPYVGKGVVLFRLVDGRLLALRATDGTELWSAEEDVPRLSLRGTSRPVISGEYAVAGFDNGRVLALNIADGNLVWESPVAPPTGRSELERLVDIDTALLADQGQIYVVTYQGKAAQLDQETGQPVWTRDLSSYSGLAIDEASVYVSTADGAVIRLNRRDGFENWRQEALTRRRLSPPAVLGDFVVVADFDGYVHFLDRATGQFASRVHPLDTRVTTPPVISGDNVVMMDAEGDIVALRVRAQGEAASGTVIKGGSSGGSSQGSSPDDGPRAVGPGDSGFDTHTRPGG
jgi:outer membrane protein assembly factor BamB